MTDVDRILTTVRDSVTRITGIPAAEIQPASSFRDDLGLDSLSALEVTVDIEYAFKVKIPEERLQGIKTVQDTMTVVQELLTASHA